MELVGTRTLLLFGVARDDDAMLLNNAPWRRSMERPELANWWREHSRGATAPRWKSSCGPWGRRGQCRERSPRGPPAERARAMRAGENVFLSIASANHDPRVFREPGRLDLGAR